MKVLVVVSVFVAAAIAEPPLSKSYLPPSSQGYPQGPQGFGGPQVASARSLEQGHGHGHHDHAANGFGRSAGGHHAQGRFAGGNQGYDNNASPFGRNGLDDEEPANYNFGYMVNDYQEGTDFGHHEERQEEKAHGEYHVVLPDGRKQTVSYEADERGFKPHIKYEDADSDASARSGGYDSNANNARSQDHHGNGFGRSAFGNGGGHHGNGFNGAARSNGY